MEETEKIQGSWRDDGAKPCSDYGNSTVLRPMSFFPDSFHYEQHRLRQDRFVLR